VVFTKPKILKKWEDSIMSATILAISNQKGGVGKTTTTANLGTALARLGYKTLLVDCDPQGSLSATLGYKSHEDSISLTTVFRQIIMNDPECSDPIIHHEAENVDLIPADISLAAMETTLINVSVDREYILKDYLDSVKDQYEYILIDCMPSLGMLTLNALVAADTVLIPVQAAYLSAKGLEQLLATIGKIKRRLNPGLQISGILMTMMDSRTNNAKDITASIQQAYGQRIRIFGTNIPRSVRAEESPAAGKSLLAYDPEGKVTAAYQSLAGEVLCRG
jgi:chromosome partitioning protein